MAHPFDSDWYRYGSAAFAGEEELAAARMFEQTSNALFCGFFKGRPLWYSGDGGILKVAGARAGKLRDVLAYNVCSGVMAGVTLMILDVKGELAAISQNQIPDKKFGIYWNPHGLHGLPQHRINPFGHLTWSSTTLFSDMKLAFEGLLPSSGAAQSRYFELNARRIGEALGLALVKKNGVLTFPDLYDTILLLQEGGERWLDFAWEMYNSGIPLCRAVKAEIDAAWEDGSGGFKGILGELTQAVACLSDPVLRESLSPPYDVRLSDLCGDQPYQVYVMCPPELVETWAAVIKAIFTAAMTLKSRAPTAPRQTWLLDEAGRLQGYDQVVRLFTYGAGIGIRPIAVFQDTKQMRSLSRDADNIIASSAGLQIYFGVRDIDTARRVSDMAGAETLSYDDPLHQGRAELAHRRAVGSVLAGADPFQAVFEIEQARYESEHLTKQHRRLRTPDEVMTLPDSRMMLFADRLSGPVYAERAPYWTQAFMAGRYHPNPYHPPSDKVLVQTRRGPRWRPVITEPVPEAYAHYPQYRDGMWSCIGENDE